MALTIEQPTLIITPHPLTLHGQRMLATTITPGDSLACLLEREGVLPGSQWMVSIGGVDVPEAQWGRVRPKHGHLIECRRVPEKDVLRIVAVAALGYFTFGAGGIGALQGAASFGAKLLAGVAYMAGTIVINKLLGPKSPSSNRQESTTSPTYSVSGGRNRARPFEPLALVLGEPYAVPDLSAQPYTYFANNEQYLWQIFHLGINCADAFDVRIGQTSIGSYQGVSVLRNGLASGNSALPALGTSVDSVPGALLEAPAGSGAWTIRTSSAGTVRLAVDLVASLYNVNAETGAFSTRTLDIGIEYRLVGSGTWLPFTPGIAGVPAVTEEVEQGIYFSYTRVLVPAVPSVPAGTVRLSNASQKPLRRTVELAVAAGQYEVRVRKVDADYTGTQGSNQAEFVQLKSYQQDSGIYSGQARLAVQIQASGQLNGALDELNAVLRAKPMPYWNGSAWVTATDRATGLCNPGAIFLLLARGIYRDDGRRLAGLGLSDDQIDIEGLKRFMVHCAAKGFQFDLVLQEAISIQDLLDAVAYAGLGEVSWPDGKLGVTFFASTDPIEGVISMASIKARSFSVAYDTLPTADELEFQYFDRARGNAWKSLRVVAPGVVTPRSTGRQSLTGVTSEAHAAYLARFSMAQNIYQRKTVTCELDLEYMTFRKGAVVAMSHDLTQWGYSGRLAACEDVAGEIRITLDDLAPGTNPVGGASARYIGLRLPGESQMRVFPVKAFSGDSRSVVLDAPWPVGVPLPGASAGNPAHDTLWIYDFKSVPGQRLRIVAIEPVANGARLQMVPETSEFWAFAESGAYTPPPGASLLRPSPVVTSVVISEQLARQGNTFYTELSLSFESAGAFSRAELWGGEGVGTETPPMRKLASSMSQTLAWRGGLDERWHLMLQVFGDLKVAEPYRMIYDVRGLRAPPEPFDVFTVLAQPDGTRQFNFAYTTTPAPVDWLGAEIRYLPGLHATPDWESMQPLQVDRSYYTASPVEINQLLSGEHTFACRSRDTTGNTSTLKYFQLNLPPRRLGNVVAEFDERELGWSGSLSGCAVNTASNTIEANDTSTWSSLTTWDAWTRWTMVPASPISYVTEVKDLSAVLTCLIDVALVVVGSAVIEVRSSETSDDPVAAPSAWTSWGPADAKVVGRYIQIRVTVTATGGAPVPGITSMSYVVSAPLINEYINDVDIATLTGGNRIGVGDIRIPIQNDYGSLLELQVVIQDASVGAWSWVLIDKNLVTGPRVQFRLNGTLADPDLVDFIVKGF